MVVQDLELKRKSESKNGMMLFFYYIFQRRKAEIAKRKLKKKWTDILVHMQML